MNNGNRRTLRDRLALACATAGGVGLLPVMPGTAGTIAGMGLWLIAAWSPWPWMIELAMLVVVVVVGIWSGGRAEKLLGATDPHAVVVDEVAGALVTFFMVAPSMLAAIAGLVLNRFFDIVKPYPIGRLQRLPGGWGIMVDDLAAGVASALVLRAVLLLAEKAWF